MDFANSMQAGSLRSDAKRIWQQNRMAIRAGEVHKEALKCGDAYMIVWPDQNGHAVMYPNRATNISVTYDEDSPGKIAWAAKYWRTADKFVRLNLFYPDRIEKYISRNESEGTLPDFNGFVPFVERERTTPSAKRVHPSFVRRGAFEGERETASIRNPQSTIRNPYGVVPVFHFANNADIGAFGQSELTSAIPIQDGLNKSVLDMLVAMEFSAFRQRWIAGLEVETDQATGKQLIPFQAGVERLWIAANSDTKFGDFNTANLDQFLRVKDGFRSDIASVTGTPLHYLLQTTGVVPSGESLRKSETRFLAKVLDRQTAFGQVWADVMAFALMIEGKGRDIRLLTEWDDPAPMSEREVLENILLKKQIGLSAEQALIEAGYGEADVKGMAPVA